MKLITKQKTIFGIIIPLVLFFVALNFANEFGSAYGDGIAAFDWNSTWFVWAIYVLLVVYLEYKIFTMPYKPRDSA